jgi:hypothetical protein
MGVVSLVPVGGVIKLVQKDLKIIRLEKYKSKRLEDYMPRIFCFKSRVTYVMNARE